MDLACFGLGFAAGALTLAAVLAAFVVVRVRRIVRALPLAGLHPAARLRPSASRVETDEAGYIVPTPKEDP